MGRGLGENGAPHQTWMWRAANLGKARGQVL